MSRASWVGFFVAVASCAPADRALFVPAPLSPFAVGRSPGDVAVADLSGDGRLDIVTANAGSGDITLLRGDGAGGFTPAAGPPPIAPPPHLVIATDLDRDGRVDLALTSHDSHGVVVLRGDGRGGFTLAPGSPFAALAGGKAHNHGLAAGDLNGDGWPDLTTVDDESHGLAVLLADGSGGFRPAPRSPFPVGREPYPHALGDVDRDGHLDAVVPNVRSGTLGVLIGDGRGGFTDAPGSPIRMEVERPYFVALGDIDGSGSLDAVVTHDDTSRITVLLGDGRGRFSPAPGPALDVGRRPWKAALGDITGDGRLDLVLGGGGQAVVLEGDGHGRFAPLRGSPFPLGREAWSVALADVDGNGRLDIVSADLGQDTVTVLLGR